MRSAYLQHHGILCQKWGIRRFEDKNGKLTSAGKARYRKSDVERDFDNAINENKDTYSRVISNGSKMVDLADDLMNEYQKEFKKVQLDDSAKKQINRNLEASFGKGCDDPEIFSLVVEDSIRDELMNQVHKNKSFKEKRDSFEKFQDDYWKDVHQISQKVEDKWNDKTVHDFGSQVQQGKWVVNDLLGSKLETRFPAYIYRHFDDYWVYDTDGYSDAIDRLSREFSMTEYNKKHGG